MLRLQRLQRVAPSVCKPRNFSTKITRPQEYPLSVKLWLGSCTGLVATMVVVGGITRLTKSGLSITEWKPVLGTLPPMNEQEWSEEFEKYKKFPEYQKVNYGMSLKEFKSIFWWEYGHRLLGRAIGVVFALPLTYFLARRKLRFSDPLVRNLGGIFLLGGSQGALGWYMVKSGLEEYRIESNNQRPRVSPYRLAAHLCAAFVIYTGLVWQTLNVIWPAPQFDRSSSIFTAVRKMRGAVFGAVALAFTTAMSGAFVAGNEAGLIYNEFPLMGGGLVPPEGFRLRPVWKNFFENDAIVQFDHRVLAITTFLHINFGYLAARRRPQWALLPLSVRRGSNLLLLAVWGQVGLGITTLLTFVPVNLAALHQAGSLALLTASLTLLHLLRYVR